MFRTFDMDCFGRNDDRFFPFLGPLLIGGLAGYALGRPWGVPFGVPFGGCGPGFGGGFQRPQFVFVNQPPTSGMMPQNTTYTSCPNANMNYGNIMSSDMNPFSNHM